jgi:bla regulator protein BlaR1
MSLITEFALTVSGSFVLLLIVKATVVCAGTLVVAGMARRGRASVRHLVIATGFTVLLALPLAPTVMPARDVIVPLREPARGVPVESVPSLDLAALPTPSSGSLANGAVQGERRTWVRPASVDLLVVIWLTGTAVFLTRMIAALMQLRRLRREGLPWREGEMVTAQVAATLAIHRRIVVLVDDVVEGPMTCGIVRPAIVLPRDARHWVPSALRRAIVHELEHIRRADWLTLCVARTVCACYWFHPLVWVLWRHLRLEAERACDDAVLRTADGEIYADQLVTLAERLADRRAPALLAMASRGDLSVRVRAVLDNRQRRGRAGRLWIATASVAAVLLIAWVAPLRAVAVARGLASTSDSRVVTQSRPDVVESSAPLTPQAQRVPASAATIAATAADPQVPQPAVAPQVAPRFEVASIKPNTSGQVLPSLPTLAPGRVSWANVGLRQLLNISHDIQAYQLVGLSSWAETARFDINATAPANATAAEVLAMVRSLLVDRFHLVTRREMRQVDIYTLELVAEGSSKLRRSQADCGAVANMPLDEVLAATQGAGDGRESGAAPARCQIFPMIGRGRVIATGARLSDLTNILTGVAGRRVVDGTGLEGAFDVNLTWLPDPGMQTRLAGVAPPPAQPDAPSIFTALQEQLGLRLVAGVGPVEMLVVERLELPTPD